MEHCIWVHEFRQQAEQTADDYAATLLPRGITRVYAKAMDGQNWMGEVYAHPLVPTGVAGMQMLIGAFNAVGLQLIPWAVPRGDAPEAEAQLHADLAFIAGGVVIDWEFRYRGFFDRGHLAEAERYFQVLSDRGVPWLGICPDPRQVGRDYPADLIAGCHALLPQCYWTDFRQPWRSVVEQAWNTMPPGPSFEPAYPYNASPEDMDAALQWAQAQGAPSVSLWRMGTANGAQLDAFSAYADPQPAPQPEPQPEPQPQPQPGPTPIVVEIPGTDLVVVHRGDINA